MLEEHGFAGRWAFRGNYPGGKCYGMTEEQMLRLYREADAFLNVTASQELREEHLACPPADLRRIRPVRAQIKVAQGETETIAALEAARHAFQLSARNLGRARIASVPLKQLPLAPDAAAGGAGPLGQSGGSRGRRGPTPPSPPGRTRARTSFTRRDLLLVEGPRVHEDHRSAQAPQAGVRTGGGRG